MDALSLSVEPRGDDCDNLGSEIGSTLDKFLHIGDTRGKNHASNNVESIGDEEDNELEGHLVSSNNWEPFANSPSEESAESKRSEESAGNVSSLTASLQTPVKLISAMKGSREKGAPPKKLTVTWSPDVYDPPPTNLEAILIRDTKQQKVPKKERKSGKKIQKGKNFSRVVGSGKDLSRGVGKDRKKKLHRRADGSSRHHDMFYGDDDDGGQNLDSSMADLYSGISSSKDVSPWDPRGKKKRNNHGMEAFVRRYDFPSSDEDTDDEDDEDSVENHKASDVNSNHGDVSGKETYPHRGGGKGKKIKQNQKMAVRNQRCYDMPPDKDDENEEEEEVENSSSRNPDSNCGSSFLEGSLKELHFAVAKAL